MRTRWVSHLRHSVLLLGSLGILQAQGTTGTILGTVTDSQDRMIAGAAVSLVNEKTGDVRETKANASGNVGDFVFTAVPLGDYTIKVTAAGFRPSERRGLALSSNQVLSAGRIALAVGSTTDSVTVSAETVGVQIASSETSAQ